MNNHIVVTYSPEPEERAIYREVLEDIARVDYLAETPEAERAELMDRADALVALSFSQREISAKEISHLEKLRFIQLVYAGADRIPFALIPKNVILASNTGAYAEPIAEHVLALTLALAKNLIPRFNSLCEGRFDRTGFNRTITGGVCAIVGFGGNGRAISRIMRAAGMKVHGINRSGQTVAPVDFMGKVSDLKRVLQSADVVVVTTPLTRETRGMLGARELAWMKPDAILINVGRGDVIDQQALYAHLKSNPDFRAGIDTWWSEPAGNEAFELDCPFFDLPNIIGSPHVADHVPNSMPNATLKALENVRNFLTGNEIRGVLNRNDYLT